MGEGEVTFKCLTRVVNNETEPLGPLGLGEFGFFRLETGADIALGLTVYDLGAALLRR